MSTHRVAALYDIHGNLPALEAVLDEVRQAPVDQIVIGGDVLPGPMPRETLRCLLDLDIPVQFIYGNSEVAVPQQMAGTTPASVPAQYRPAIRWTAEEVQDYRDVLAAWPMTLRVDVRGLGNVLFCHATPRNEDECFTRLTPEDRLLPVFDGLGASVVVCGHTHMQFDRVVGRTRVVERPPGGTPAPLASFVLLAIAAF
jgi:predicted phosphodiesterase